MKLAGLPPNPDPVLNQPITPELVRKHGLLPDEYEAVRGHLGRDPTLTELGIFSVMWSEHCSYKNTRPLLKGFPTEKRGATAAFGRVLVKAGEENAGIIDVGDGWAIAFKIESHNHPSAVEPFEGAATGVGGIIRDIFTMGARPVLLTNSLRFGELDSPVTRRLLRGVVAGIAHYGNCVGVPTVGGDVYFDRSYEGNPLVNALCLGTLRHDQIRRGKATGLGNPVYYVGAATGRDGLGGAAFASRELSAESAADRPAVQKGDPFMEKLLIEACLEMMAVPGLVVGIQDMGAAGLTCSTCETASRGRGRDRDRARPGAPARGRHEFLRDHAVRVAGADACHRPGGARAGDRGGLREVGPARGARGLGDRHRADGGQAARDIVADIPASALTDDAPVYQREARRPAYLDTTSRLDPGGLGARRPGPRGRARGAAAGSSRIPTIASKRWIYRQYDHMVQHGTVVLPGSDAGRRAAPARRREKFIAISNDCNGRYCYLNPRRGAQIAMVECLRNLVCAGAAPLAMTDNLNFGNPYKPENFYQLRECVARARRGVQVLRRAGRRGQRLPLQRVARGGDRPDAHRLGRGLHRGGGPHHPPVRPGAGLPSGPPGRRPAELGGSQFLGLIHGMKTGRRPGGGPGGREEAPGFPARADPGRAGGRGPRPERGRAPGGALRDALRAGEPRRRGRTCRASRRPRLDALLFGESQGRVIAAVAPADEAASSPRGRRRRAGRRHRDRDRGGGLPWRRPRGAVSLGPSPSCGWAGKRV